MAKSSMMTESEVDSDDDNKPPPTSQPPSPTYNHQSLPSIPLSDNKEPNIINDNHSISVVSKRPTVSTPISILITSLVKDLCSAYATDAQQVAAMYKLICDKLFQMNLIDESYGMAEFEGMRIEYQKAFHQLLKHSMRDEKVALRPALPINDWVHSHYYQEFDEIEYIAGGGFGQVYRVKHKLDGSEYAVKKIPIRADGIKAVRNYLSEVKTFASLNHSNIVQYKAAWLELGCPLSSSTSLHPVDTDYETSYEVLSTKNQQHQQQQHHLVVDSEYIYHQDEILEFSSDKKLEDTSDFEVNFEHSASSVTNHSVKNKKKRVKRNSISEGGKAICKLDLKEIEQLKMEQKSRMKWATLYIQMALCQSTLKQWLESRNDSELKNEAAIIPMVGHVRNETIYVVLRQLLKGLEYIHSKGIVHHDIKPSNIFIQLENGNLLVQLGDFGLACPLQSVHHSLALGTKLYAAPEQLAGKCDPKSDMYSLGIVLFELVEQFRTDMERVQYINDLRKGKLPTHIHVQYPQLAQIICQLVERNPQERPDATSLLKVVTNNSDTYIQELEFKLAQRDEEIERLKELLKSAGVKSI